MSINITLRVTLVVLLLGVALPSLAAPDSTTSNAVPDSTELSLDQLINIKVTSVAKEETSLENSPAAVTVVTPNDIEEFGITTLPDALRLVPGMDVAQINSHEWAISSRGFNGEFADKMLVLIDGRSVYTTGFAGVIWGMEDVDMEDVDRIEVIRGPGGTLWGDNAVNGVINIISKSAKDTQGLMIVNSAGTDEDQPSTLIRYGGVLDSNLYYRVYVKYFNRDGLVLTNGSDAQDPWSGIQGGLRLDWEPNLQNKLTLQGDYFSHESDEHQSLPSLLPPYGISSIAENNDNGGNMLGRWTHDFANDSELTVQSYLNYFNPQQIGVTYTSYTADLDAQYRLALGSRNDVIWGADYRYISDKLVPSSYLAFSPSSGHEEILSTFLQDEITLVPDRLKLTLGSKFENNSFTGFEIQPSARLLWTPTERQAVWASVSRAVRTPSVSEMDEAVNFEVLPPTRTTPPILITDVGNPNLKSEDLVAYELGYRVEPTKRCSFDLTTFYNNYNRIIAGINGAPEFETSPSPYLLIPSVNENAGPAQTYGVELSGRLDVADFWHLSASWSWLETHSPLLSNLSLGASPAQQLQARSVLNLTRHLDFNVSASYVDQIEAPYGTGQMAIPAYVRVDVGLVWHPWKNLEVGIWGQNLLDAEHAEFTSYKTPLITEIPRSMMAKITLKF